MILRKRNLRPHLIALMEKYDVPFHIIVHFRRGKGDLYGQYFVYDEAVAEHLAIIDIYTKPFEDGMQIYPDYDLDFNLLDTFAHELIHHMREGERQTKKETRIFMGKVAELL